MHRRLRLAEAQLPSLLYKLVFWRLKSFRLGLPSQRNFSNVTFDHLIYYQTPFSVIYVFFYHFVVMCLPEYVLVHYECTVFA